MNLDIYIKPINREKFVCDFMSNSNETPEIIRQWNIIGYCSMKGSNITENVCTPECSKRFKDNPDEKHHKGKNQKRYIK